MTPVYTIGRGFNCSTWKRLCLHGTWRFCIVRQVKLKRFIRFPFRCLLPGCLPSSHWGGLLKTTRKQRAWTCFRGVLHKLIFPRKWCFFEDKIEAKRSSAMKKHGCMKRCVFSAGIWRDDIFCQGMDLMISKIITAYQSHGLDPSTLLWWYWLQQARHPKAHRKRQDMHQAQSGWQGSALRQELAGAFFVVEGIKAGVQNISLY